MVTRLHPALPFLQIQNKDNDNIVLLAPPRPWRRQRRFTAAVFTAIESNKSRTGLNGKRISGEDGGLVCTTFAPRLMMNYMIRRCADAPIAPGCGGGVLQRRKSSPLIKMGQDP